MRKGLLSTKVAFLHCSFSKLKPHLKIRFIALQPIIFPTSSFKESSAHPTERSFRTARSTLSMTLMLHCSALRVCHLWFYLFINLEVITATLNQQRTQGKEKWQHSAYESKPGARVCLSCLSGPLRADIKMSWRDFRFTQSYWSDWLSLNTLQ